MLAVAAGLDDEVQVVRTCRVGRRLDRRQPGAVDRVGGRPLWIRVLYGEREFSWETVSGLV